MNKRPYYQNEQIESLNKIKEILHSFCEKYLNVELKGYAMKLCDVLGKKRGINLSRSKKEIWAASIIYVIARLNFLFDKENEKYITTDTICNFFNTNKSTVGNKATQIEKVCNLTIGAEGYCSKQITDSFSFYQTPEGFVVPKSMIENREIVFEVAEGEEAEELEKFVVAQRKIKEQKIKEKKERRDEINRKIAEKRKKKKDYENRQLNLFDNL